MPLSRHKRIGANRNGSGALLAFELDGSLRGTSINQDRIADPRGLAVDPKKTRCSSIVGPTESWRSPRRGSLFATLAGLKA
jgi:hypothetical protein